MKKYIFLMVLCTLALSTNTFAQSTNSDGWQVSPLTVNGLHLWQKYTKEEIIAALGAPLSVKDYKDEEDYHYQGLYYSNSDFEFLDNRLTAFTIREVKYKINNIITVGDSVLKLNQLIGGGPLTLNQWKSGEKYYKYPIDINSDTSLIISFDFNNIITKIEFNTNML